MYIYAIFYLGNNVAEFAGCSTENVIMTLSRWQNEKIISVKGKMLSIVDIEKLQHISKIG
jgi:hypothetical protein